MLNTSLPAWTQSLTDSLHAMADSLRQRLVPPSFPERIYLPEDETGFDSTHATPFIQRAIDRAAESGGIVRLTEGDYVSGTLVLRSHVCLEIQKHARLLGSTDLTDYPEHHARVLTVQDTSMGMHQSLLFAEDCCHISLRGEGEIDMRGTPDHFPGDETAQGTPGRPFMLRFLDCRDIHVAGLTFRNAACWMQNYLHCENLLIENLSVSNHANYNNDGMDIDGCRNVWVHDCCIHSGDDALCFKGASMQDTENVLIERCTLFSACNAVKIGTDTQGSFRNILVRDCVIGGLAHDPSGLKHAYADSGISLESVDGGTVEDMAFENITMERAWSPLFLRIDDRARTRPGDPRPGIGCIRRILFSDIRGTDCGPRGSYFLGYPGGCIQDIALSDVWLHQHAWKAAPPSPDFPDLHLVYPDAHMIDPYGASPAYGLYARHVSALSLVRVLVLAEEGETRERFLMDPSVTWHLQTDTESRIG